MRLTEESSAPTIPRTGRARLSRVETVALFSGACLVLLRAAPTLYAEWTTNPNCTHVAFTLPLGAFFLVTALRETLQKDTAPPRRPAWLAGGALLLVSAALLYLDAALDEESLLAAGLLLGLLGTVAVLFGQAALKASIFPAVLIAFAVPLPYSIARNVLHINLQRASAECSSGVLSLCGLNAQAAGAVVTISGIELNVAEACSGLKFVTVLAFAGLVAGRIILPSSMSGRFALVASAAAAAFLTNVARLVAAGLVARGHGLHAAESFLHSWSVWPLYALGVASLLAVAVLLRSAAEHPLPVVVGDPA